MPSCRSRRPSRRVTSPLRRKSSDVVGRVCLTIPRRSEPSVLPVVAISRARWYAGRVPQLALVLEVALMAAEPAADQLSAARMLG